MATKSVKVSSEIREGFRDCKGGISTTSETDAFLEGIKKNQGGIYHNTLESLSLFCNYCIYVTYKKGAGFQLHGYSHLLGFLLTMEVFLSDPSDYPAEILDHLVDPQYCKYKPVC